MHSQCIILILISLCHLSCVYSDDINNVTDISTTGNNNNTIIANKNTTETLLSQYTNASKELLKEQEQSQNPYIRAQDLRNQRLGLGGYGPLGISFGQFIPNFGSNTPIIGQNAQNLNAANLRNRNPSNTGLLTEGPLSGLLSFLPQTSLSSSDAARRRLLEAQRNHPFGTPGINSPGIANQYLRPNLGYNNNNNNLYPNPISDKAINNNAAKNEANDDTQDYDNQQDGENDENDEKAQEEGGNDSANDPANDPDLAQFQNLQGSNFPADLFPPGILSPADLRDIQKSMEEQQKKEKEKAEEEENNNNNESGEGNNDYEDQGNSEDENNKDTHENNNKSNEEAKSLHNNQKSDDDNNNYSNNNFNNNNNNLRNHNSEDLNGIINGYKSYPDTQSQPYKPDRPNVLYKDDESNYNSRPVFKYDNDNDKSQEEYEPKSPHKTGYPVNDNRPTIHYDEDKDNRPYTGYYKPLTNFGTNEDIHDDGYRLNKDNNYNSGMKDNVNRHNYGNNRGIYESNIQYGDREPNNDNRDFKSNRKYTSLDEINPNNDYEEIYRPRYNSKESDIITRQEENKPYENDRRISSLDNYRNMGSAYRNTGRNYDDIYRNLPERFNDYTRGRGNFGGDGQDSDRLSNVEPGVNYIDNRDYSKVLNNGPSNVNKNRDDYRFYNYNNNDNKYNRKHNILPSVDYIKDDNPYDDDVSSGLSNNYGQNMNNNANIYRKYKDGRLTSSGYRQAPRFVESTKISSANPFLKNA